MPKGGSRMSGSMKASSMKAMSRVKGNDTNVNISQSIKDLLNRADEEGIRVPSGTSIVFLPGTNSFTSKGGVDAWGTYDNNAKLIRVATKGRKDWAIRRTIAHEIGHANHYLIHPDSGNWTKQQREDYASAIAEQLIGK